MKPGDKDDIGYGMGWLCGALFAPGPIAALVYLVRRKRRKAFQATATSLTAFSCILGARALMLWGGWQHRQALWRFLNVVILIAFPLLALRLLRALRWPRPTRR